MNASLPISSGYLKDFALHTDDAFSEYAGAFLGLRCLRNPDHVPTKIAHFLPSQIDTKDILYLSSAAYQVLPNVAHSVDDSQEPKSILFGSVSAPYFRMNANRDATLKCSSGEKAAYDQFMSILQNNQQSITLSAGDCLYIDNFRAAHAREAYLPRLDGTDRWLRRVYVSKDLRPSRALRDAPHSRIVRTTK